MAFRDSGPELPDDISADELDHEVRAELRSLARPVAETVARRLVATGQLVDDDPEAALGHAVAARRLASRIPAVREAVGIAAYHAGEWQTAIAELRTYHRMTGRQNHLAVLADCERALGRPEKAIDIYRSAEQSELDPGDAIELLIVAAGARRDLGADEAAVAMLQVRELTQDAPWAARLRYAYADGLLAVDRREEAREWFARAVEADDDATTDAAERLLDLDGVTLEGDDQDDEDDEIAADDEVATDGDLDPDDVDADEELDGQGEDGLDADNDADLDHTNDEDEDDEDEDEEDGEDEDDDVDVDLDIDDAADDEDDEEDEDDEDVDLSTGEIDLDAVPEEDEFDDVEADEKEGGSSEGDGSITIRDEDGRPVPPAEGVA